MIAWNVNVPVPLYGAIPFHCTIARLPKDSKKIFWVPAGFRSSQNGAIRFSGAPVFGSGWFEYEVALLVNDSQPLVQTRIESKKVP